jgi:hypothetical protein
MSISGPMTHAVVIPVIANADPVMVGMGVVNMVLSVLMGIVLAWFGVRQRRVEAMEHRITALVKESADERHVLTTKLVDERFRAMTHELGNSGQQLVLAVAELRQRVKEAEAELDGAGERNHKIELTVADKVDQIKDLIREATSKTATRADLEKHESQVSQRDQRLGERLGKVEQSIAVLAEVTNRTAKRGQ